MLGHACERTSNNSSGLSGHHRPSTQEIVSETVSALFEGIDIPESHRFELETKNLCVNESSPRVDCDDFLIFVLRRLMSVIKNKFIICGGQLFVCTHEVKRKGDRFLFPNIPDMSSLSSYVGISFKVILRLTEGQQKDDVAYDSLFSPGHESSCFPLSLMSELQNRGIVLKTERHLRRQSGVIYTLFFPKETKTVQ